MFEAKASPQLAALATVDDAAVIDGLGSSARAENAAGGRRLAWMGELYARRAPEDDEERTCWAIDGHANVVAEISAALNISRGRAAGQLQYAIALRERRPKVAEVFAGGAIDFRMMAALVNRSDNVTDPAVLAGLDVALAKVGAEVDETVGAQADRARRYVGGEVRPGRGACAAPDPGEPVCGDRAVRPGDGRDLGQPGGDRGRRAG